MQTTSIKGLIMPYLGSYSNTNNTDPSVTAIGRAQPIVIQLNAEGKLVYTIDNANLYAAFAQFDEEIEAQSSIQREDKSNTTEIKMKADAGELAANKYVNFFYYLKP